MRGRFELSRPEGIDEDGWQAIANAQQRLSKVFGEGDHHAVLGAAKDLVESVAKVVLVARGDSPDRKNMNQLLTAAHKSLDSSASRGRAAQEPHDSMLQNVRDLMPQTEIAPMRNQAGTGHGRPTPTPVYGEHAFSGSADAAMLWCRWALERFGEVHRSSPAWLIEFLATSVFHKDEVAGHLAQIDLAQLPDPDLDCVGRALAQRRRMTATRVV